jgi:hypothetical protein
MRMKREHHIGNVLCGGGRSVQPKLAMKGLGWVNFRIMRRTFITLGKVSGADPKAMADQAGHDIEKLILLDRVLLWTKEAKRCFLERGTGVEPV